MIFSKYIYIAVALAFLALSGLCFYQRQEVRAAKAEAALIAKDRDEALDVAKANFDVVVKLKTALDACQLQLFKQADNNKAAQDQQAAAYKSIADKLAAAE